MKRTLLLSILFLTVACCSALSQERQYMPLRGGVSAGYEIINGDTVQCCMIAPVYVFRRAKDMRQYQRLVRNVKKVYPIAKQARMYFDTLNVRLDEARNDRERERITKAMEKQIVARYTPILKEMTYSQGKVLIKLIDRETDRTSYQLLRDFRGKFSAGFWNTVARMFKANLKTGYDAEGEDKLIEQIITLYEAGLL